MLDHTKLICDTNECCKRHRSHIIARCECNVMCHVNHLPISPQGKPRYEISYRSNLQNCSFLPTEPFSRVSPLSTRSLAYDCCWLIIMHAVLCDILKREWFLHLHLLKFLGKYSLNCVLYIWLYFEIEICVETTYLYDNDAILQLMHSGDGHRRLRVWGKTI